MAYRPQINNPEITQSMYESSITAVLCDGPASATNRISPNKQLHLMIDSIQQRIVCTFGLDDIVLVLNFDDIKEIEYPDKDLYYFYIKLRNGEKYVFDSGFYRMDPSKFIGKYRMAYYFYHRNKYPELYNDKRDTIIAIVFFVVLIVWIIWNLID